MVRLAAAGPVAVKFDYLCQTQETRQRENGYLHSLISNFVCNLIYRSHDTADYAARKNTALLSSVKNT